MYAGCGCVVGGGWGGWGGGGGGIFAGYYMADFTGVNGRIFEKVSKSTRQVLYFGVL